MVSPHLSSDATILHSLDASDRLFTHKRRPKWGLGLWVKEERSRRTLVFQDGRMRTFKQGYYGLLKPVDPDEVDVEEAYEQLASEHELAEKDKIRQEARAERPPVMSFKQQLQVFQHTYPGGFDGEAWVETHRRPDPGRKPRKGHLSHARDVAREELGEERLRRMLDEADHAGIYEAMLSTLRRTDLVDLRRDVRPLEDFDEVEQRMIAAALVHLLWGEARYRQRFKRWLEVFKRLGLQPSWSLATVLPALVHPDEHVWVKHRAIDLQARSLRPSMSLRQTPNRRGYRKARGLLRKVRRRLEKQELGPADMLDVSTFVWDTLRPRGVKTLTELGS